MENKSFWLTYFEPKKRTKSKIKCLHHPFSIINNQKKVENKQSQIFTTGVCNTITIWGGGKFHPYVISRKHTYTDEQIIHIYFILKKWKKKIDETIATIFFLFFFFFYYRLFLSERCCFNNVIMQICEDYIKNHLKRWKDKKLVYNKLTTKISENISLNIWKKWRIKKNITIKNFYL